jgi:hypothetical protein
MIYLPQNDPYIHGGFDVLILDLLLDVYIKLLYNNPYLGFAIFYSIYKANMRSYSHGGFDVLILDLFLDVCDILVIILCSQANQSINRPIDKFTNTNWFRALPYENELFRVVFRIRRFRMLLVL